MLMTLTIKLSKINVQLDIQVNHQQKIRDVLTVLAENNLLPGEYSLDSLQIKSERKKEYINSMLTFEQAIIYTGDCLILS